MYTIAEIIYNIRKQLKDTSDDLRLTDRNLEFMVNYLREKLIVQQLQKGRSISANIKQDLGKLSVTLVDRNTGDAVKTGRYIYKTNLQIPQPIEGDQKDMITYIGGLDKMSPIDFKTKDSVTWNKYNKFSSKLQQAYLNNGYVY